MTQKEVWGGDLSTRHCCIMKQVYSDEKKRRAVSVAVLERYKDPVRREAARQGALKRWKNPEERKKQGLRSKSRWNDPDYYNRVCESLLRVRLEHPEWFQNCFWRNSEGESIIERILSDCDIEFRREFIIPVKGEVANRSFFRLDFTFGDNLNLECDGIQHESPEHQYCDKRRDAFLETKGWNIVRVPWLGAHKYYRDPEYKKEFDSKIELFIRESLWQAIRSQ